MSDVQTSSKPIATSDGLSARSPSSDVGVGSVGEPSLDSLVDAWLPYIRDNRALIMKLAGESKLLPAEVIALMSLKTLSAVLLRVDGLAAMKQAELMGAQKTDKIILT